MILHPSDYIEGDDDLEQNFCEILSNFEKCIMYNPIEVECIKKSNGVGRHHC